MKKYVFDTAVTMKEYNHNKWWINSDIIEQIVIDAETVKEAVLKYAETVAERFYVNISKTAIKRKRPMYIDTKEGTKQTGYVITASTDFDKNGREWVKEYVDLWVEIYEKKTAF